MNSAVPSPPAPPPFPVELFFSALNASVDSVILVDTEGRILWVNSAFEKLTGYSYREAIGNKTSILKSGKHPQEFYRGLWQTLIDGGIWKGEIWNRRKDGSLYLEEMTITPVLDEDNSVTHFVCVKRDISERSALHRQLEHANRMEAIGDLTGGISHNFNNKLTTILGYGELAEELARRSADESLQSYVAKIMAAGNELKELVQELRTFCREKPLEHKEISPFELIRAFEKLVRASIPSSVELKLQINDPQGLIKGDNVKLQQMLLILTYNAVAAMSKQGKLTIKLDRALLDAEICSSCHADISGQFVRISVEDEGCGISNDNLSKIFLPFFSSDRGASTGMGLAVLHGMLHELNGHVLVTSEPGKGSCFNLYFPILNEIKKAVKESTEIVSKQIDESVSAKRILVVDDDPVMTNLIKEILRLKGYRVSAKNSVKKALSLILKHPQKFDLLITDQCMPGISGMDIIQAIKTLRNDMPIMLISGKERNEICGSKPGDNRISAFLRKPFKRKQLLDHVERLVSAK